MAGPPRCELCGARPAPRTCPRCRRARYCDASHQRTDWSSIHERVCPLLIPPQPCLHSEKDRKHSTEQLLSRQKAVVEVASGTARRFLRAGQALEALPAALRALRSGAHLYSRSSLQLVPLYLLLAEASTGTGNFRQASKYLSAAEWLVLQSPGCGGAVGSALHRARGLFCAARGQLEQALCHLANHVYLAASAFGADSTEVSAGYFHMANIFLCQNKRDVANSLYTEVTVRWHSRLLSSLRGHRQLPAHPTPFDEDQELPQEGMTEAQREEATQVLQGLLGVWEQQQQPRKTVQVLHSLAMLHFLGQDLPKAQEVGMKAFDLAKELPEQESLETIGHLLELINASFSHTK